jgi:hypothetical protein
MQGEEPFIFQEMGECLNSSGSCQQREKPSPLLSRNTIQCSEGGFVVGRDFYFAEKHKLAEKHVQSFSDKFGLGLGVEGALR